MNERKLRLEAVKIWQELILQAKRKYQWWELQQHGTGELTVSDWLKCGEFIETYAIELINEMLSNDFGHYQIAWSAICNYLQDDYYDGDTPQEAICRATVAVVLGGEVDVPKELLNG